MIILEKKKYAAMVSKGPSYGWTRDTALSREQYALAVAEIVLDFKGLSIKNRMRRALRRGRFNWETPDGNVVVIKRKK